MSRRLDKAQSRQRWAELRELWNEFDPIGVMRYPDWPRDEYESYCGPTLRLLEQNAGDKELEDYIQSAFDHMGIAADDNEIKDFIKKLRGWFQKYWPETRV